MSDAPTQNTVPCAPDPARLESFRDLVAHNEYPFARHRDPAAPTADDWGMGNVSTRAVAYSCGHLTHGDRPLAHRHDPDEVALCARLANEVAQRLATSYVGEGARLRPYFAAAVAGEPVPTEITEELVRRAFGGTLYPDIQFRVTRLVPNPAPDAASPPPGRGATGGRRRARSAPPPPRWPNPLGVCVRLDDLPDVFGDVAAQMAAVWEAFADWFTAVPELRAHAAVEVGFSDADPGPLKPRLLLALTAAGSLVGVVGYETHA